MNATARHAQRAANDEIAPMAPRAGMTLPEIMVAMVILVGALLGMAQFTVKFTRSVGEAQVRAAGAELASSRIEQARSQATYLAIDSLALTEIGIADSSTGRTYRGFDRRTYVQRVGDATSTVNDYKIVTVVVSGQPLLAPVKKTTVISSF